MAAKSRRAVAIVLGLLSAAALAVGAFAPNWLADVDGEDAIGLRAYRLCWHGCDGGSNGQLIDKINHEIDLIILANQTRAPDDQQAVPRRPWDGFPVTGTIAFVACLLTAAGILVGAILTIARKRIEWPIMPTTIAVLGLIVAIISGCVFVATKPDALSLVGVGWSFMVFGAGAVLGLAAVFPINRQIRPIDEELGAASATMSWGGSRDDV